MFSMSDKTVETSNLNDLDMAQINQTLNNYKSFKNHLDFELPLFCNFVAASWKEI